LSDRTPMGDRQADSREVISVTDAEKMRGDLVAGYAEVEALLRFYAGYDSIREKPIMVGYEKVCEDLAYEQRRIGELSVEALLAQRRSLPDAQALRRITEMIRRARGDEAYLLSLERADKYFQSKRNSLSPAEVKELRSRSAVSAPSNIKPACDYNDVSDFASPADVAIANGVAIAAQTAYEALPDSFSVAGFSAPNVIRIALVIAAGVSFEVANGLEADNAIGNYCQDLRFFIEDKMKDNGYIVILALPRDKGGFLDFVKDSINAIITNAQGAGMLVNACAQTRLNEANNFYSQGKWLEAYKKYQAAYQNIGANSCIQ